MLARHLDRPTTSRRRGIVRALLRPVAAVAVSAGLLVAATACTTQTPTTPYPHSMAAVGDSVTRGADACGRYSDCPAVSWSTGTVAGVSSHSARLLLHSPGLRTYNDAQTGATTADLRGQVGDAVLQGSEYLTVLIGANDVCTATTSQMTPAATVEQRVTAALRTYTAARPAGRVLVASIPDVYRLWQVGHADATARLFWSAGQICQSMLANPASTAPADAARRLAVHTRLLDDNAALARACAAVPRCRWDGGAVTRTTFALSQLSNLDYFHPNPAGQRLLADTTWRVGYWA